MLPRKNILIVYNEHRNAGIAAVRALQVFGTADTQLHLVKLTGGTNWLLALRSLFKKNADPENLLASTKDREAISRQVNTVFANYQLTPSNIRRKKIMARFSSYCMDHAIDLILVAKEKGPVLVMPASYAFYHRISRQTGVPVLLFLNDNEMQPVKSVLLPVTGFIPVKRIEIALEIARQFHARIYIATIIDHTRTDTRERAYSFYQTFKTLSESGYAPFYKVFPGKHPLQTILRYGEQVKADLVLINPDRDSSFASLTKERIAEWMHPLSLGHAFTMKPHIQSPA